MFLTIGDVNNPDIWEGWLREANPASYDIYVHAKEQHLIVVCARAAKGGCAAPLLQKSTRGDGAYQVGHSLAGEGSREPFACSDQEQAEQVSLPCVCNMLRSRQQIRFHAMQHLCRQPRLCLNLRILCTAFWLFTHKG
eukprot:3631963-Rhodomonas_salina.1